MELKQIPIKVYARKNEQGQVTQLLNTIFNSETITKIDVFVDEGFGDNYAYPHLRFNLFDNNYCHNYKIVDGIMVETAEEEKQAEILARPIQPKTELELKLEQQQEQINETTLSQELFRTTVTYKLSQINV